MRASRRMVKMRYGSQRRPSSLSSSSMCFSRLKDEPELLKATEMEDVVERSERGGGGGEAPT